MPYFHLHASPLPLIRRLLDLVLRTRDRHPVAGDEDHQLREGQQRREVLDGRRVHGSAGCPPAPGASTAAPKAPNSTLNSERFIARLIARVRMVPDAPTSAPLTMSTSLLSTNPVLAAASPVNELSSEMITGMSAPPIGTTNSTPSSERMTKIRNSTRF